MTDQPHTPTTQEIRLAHAESVTFHLMEEPELAEANNMFDRWLAARDARIEAEVEQRGKEQGWDEAMTAQIQKLISDDPDVERFQMPANPYRADLLEGDDE